METVELIGSPSKTEKIFDYFCDTLLGNIICFFGVILLFVWGVINELLHPGSFSESIESRRIAEGNSHTILKYGGMECRKDSTNNILDLKWDMIYRAIMFHLHSGRYTTEEQHRLLKYKNVCKRVFNFFERNNIDIYSDNFDIEYLAKCVREQDI